MRTFLTSLLHRLTNISQSNKALLHKKAYVNQDLDLLDLDFILENSAYSILEKTLSSCKPFKICEELDSRNEKNNLVSSRLKNILRTHNQIIEESGHNDLFLAFPYVEGKLQNDVVLRSPLLLIPISITLKNKAWYLNRRKDVSIQFNKNFLLAYAQYNNLKLEEDFLDQNLIELGTDIQVFLNNLYTKLKEADIEINFNSELFNNKINAFSAFKKQDLEHLYGTGQVKLQPLAVIGMFPQAQSYLVPDIENILEKNAFETSEKLFESKLVSHTVSKSRESQTYTPFPIDISQELSLKKIKDGASLVVQGPPGSGKSQLICNLVSDFIARGKKVLVVCQKRVALDVVYERLKEKNIHSFSARVHDIKTDRKSVYEQIENQIALVKRYENENAHIDTITNERSFNLAAQQIDNTTEELNEFKTALFSREESGNSIKELYLSTNPEILLPELKKVYAFFDANEQFKFLKSLKVWFPFIQKIELQSHPWSERKSFHSYSREDKNKLLELLEEIPAYYHSFQDQTKVLLENAIELSDCQWILEREEQLQNLLSLIDANPIFEAFKHYLDFSNVDSEWLFLKEKQLTDPLKNEGLINGLTDDNINSFIPVLEQCVKSYSSPIKRLRWWLFNKDKRWIKKVLVLNQLTYSKQNLQVLEQKIDNKLNYNHVFSFLKECDWLPELPKETSIESIKHWFSTQHAALEAWQINQDLRAFKHHLNIIDLTYEATEKKINAVLSLCKSALQVERGWHEYLLPKQVHKLIYEDDYKLAATTFITKEFDSLTEWDKNKSLWPIEYLDTLKTLNLKLGDKSFIEYESLFQNGINNLWIDHIETKYPILKIVSTPKLEQIQELLCESIKEKSTLAEEILLMKLKENTYADLEYNRLNNRVSYRDLHHQVSKKKRIWPLRKTIHEFEDELFKLIPCWLASPDAVSALFPMRDLFDLVIFDEASQCFLEEGVPSIMRGKQVCVCGDQKQLQPNDLYQTRFESETEHPDLEVNSLLDYTQRYLETITLKGHYRSLFPELIQFSNANFYNNELLLIPDKNDVSNDNQPLEYIHCKGVWESGINREEARWICNQIKLEVEKGNSDIGVVTFNQKQQHYIQDELERQFHGQEESIPPEIFIKNIENVQGDERGTIIFSIAYAPDASGRFAMNFGLLNQESGENRLNVAITRAKKKIIVVSSIYPDQLQVDDALHQGPKLLRQYLQFVYDCSKGKNAGQQTDNTSAKHLTHEIMNDLELSKLKWQDQLHFADLGLTTSSDYKLLLSDDENLNQSYAKGFFGYQKLLFAKKNWSTQNSFSRNFWDNKQEWREKILRFAHQ